MWRVFDFCTYAKASVYTDKVEAYAGMFNALLKISYPL